RQAQARMLDPGQQIAIVRTDVDALVTQFNPGCVVVIVLTEGVLVAAMRVTMQIGPMIVTYTVRVGMAWESIFIVLSSISDTQIAFPGDPGGANTVVRALRERIGEFISPIAIGHVVII